MCVASMTRLLMLCVFTAPLAADASDAETADAATGVQFRLARLVVDTGGRTLGAYQIMLDCHPEVIAIVGIEGGVPPQFAGLPAFDRRGLTAGKVRLAAFSLDRDGPKGRVCVARLHLALKKHNALASLKLTPEVIATPSGKMIDGKASVELDKPALVDKAVHRTDSPKQ